MKNFETHFAAVTGRFAVRHQEETVAKQRAGYQWDIRVTAVDNGYAVEVLQWIGDSAKWVRVNFERQKFRAQEDLVRRTAEKAFRLSQLTVETTLRNPKFCRTGMQARTSW